MFGSLKPKAGKGFNRQESVKASMFGHLYEQSMEYKITTEYGRGPEYRPSAFPLCSVRILMKLAAGLHLGYYPSEMEASGGYFTTVGTAAHENIQYYIGQSGKVWGDWACRNPTCQKRHDAQDLFDENGKCWRKGKVTRKNTTNNKCPKCAHPMDYVEKSIDYKGLKGHIDCIVKLDSGGWWIADYKTSTKFQITKGPALLPHKAHLHQVPTYAYCFAKQYKKAVHGFSVLYLSRDNPFLFYEHAELWTSEWDERAAKNIRLQRKRFIAALRSVKSGNSKAAVKLKPCKSEEHYEQVMCDYQPCPYLGACFKPGFELELNKDLNAMPHSKKDVLKLFDKMPTQLIAKL